MAAVTNARLSVTPYVTGPMADTCDSLVSYTVVWDAYDQASDQPYEVFVGLWGDDTWPNGAEDGADDAVHVPAEPVGEISSGGNSETDHASGFNGLDLSLFNEDARGADEIRAKVTLVPKTPVSATAESDHVTLAL